MTFLLIILTVIGMIFVYDGYLKNENLAPKDMEQLHVITVMEKPFYDSYRDGYLVRVRTEENAIETFQISNAYLKGEWKPEDRAGLLEANHTYQVTTWGTRNSVLHTYKNIVESRELTDNAEIERLTQAAVEANEESLRKWENLSGAAKNEANANKGGLY